MLFAPVTAEHTRTLVDFVAPRSGTQHPAWQWSADQMGQALLSHSSLGLFGGDFQLLAFVIYQDAGDHLEILWISTRPEFRGQGLGRTLLNEFKAHAKARSCRIWLETHENNHDANRLYLGAGFKQVGVRPKYYRDQGAALLYEFADLP